MVYDHNFGFVEVCFPLHKQPILQFFQSSAHKLSFLDSLTQSVLSLRPSKKLVLNLQDNEQNR